MITTSNRLREIAEEIKTQDNDCTADPLFVVRSKRIITGLDLNYCENRCWVDSYGDIVYDGDERLLTEPDDWEETGYDTIWEFVTCCFTKKAAEQFVQSNSHRYDELRIVVESLHRNMEMQLIRNFLQSLTTVTWARFAQNGYEVSTAGDARFSALNAQLGDGRSIEMHYQCDVKGYDVGGMNWRKGKGRPPLNPNIDLYREYLKLWKTWALLNAHLIDELRECVARNGRVLTDQFATTEISQARALADILNQ